MLYEDLKIYDEELEAHNILQDELERYFGGLRNKSGNARDPTQHMHMNIVQKQMYCEEAQLSGGNVLSFKPVFGKSVKENKYVKLVMRRPRTTLAHFG